MNVLRGRGRLGTKINITFFVGNEVLNIFHSTIFAKKTIFSKITAKIIFEGHDLFWGNGASDDKNEYKLSRGKWGNGYCFEVFFSKNPILTEWKSKNWFWGYILPRISGMVLLGRLFPKTIRFTHGWARTNHMNFMKIGSKLRPVSCVLIHKYISTLTLRICNQGPLKRKTWPPPPTPFLSRECQNWNSSRANSEIHKTHHCKHTTCLWLCSYQRQDKILRKWECVMIDSRLIISDWICIWLLKY